MKMPTPIPGWIKEAILHIGLKEIPGKQNNPTIIKWLNQLKGWWSEDETPWCGTFVAHCLQAAGLIPPKSWFRAKEYAQYGTPCAKIDIPYGAICVKSRVGGGHVFFAVGRSSDGHKVYGLGGNQGNKVSVVPFPVEDLDAIRWPANASTMRLTLPIVTPEEVGAVNAGSEA